MIAPLVLITIKVLLEANDGDLKMKYGHKTAVLDFPDGNLPSIDLFIYPSIYLPTYLGISKSIHLLEHSMTLI